MKTLILLIIIALLGSCRVERPAKPSATGGAGELLVVMSQLHYDGLAGLTTHETFSANVPMLLAPEPMFDLIHIAEDNFVELFQTHRHIFIADIGEQDQRASVSITENVWSQPQMVIRVSAPNDSVFREVLLANTESFSDYFISAERKRVINANNTIPNREARQLVREMFGFDMAIPEGFFVAVRGDNFMWVRRTGVREDLELGVLIASLPYRDPNVDFAHNTIWARRDSLTRIYIPGDLPGSFMTTYAELPPQFREVSFNGHYAVEARSIWRVENDFMGGPFVNYTLVQPHNNRLLILDGFVYAPSAPKRDHMRQVEALIYSIRFPETQEAQQAAQ
ncbi:MAG TPA: DUF4837 family protein [Bacteroidales bacterium]|nr:DUF4837 family protein [Bacteroidales bacterium]